MATAVLTTYTAKQVWSKGLYAAPAGGQYSPVMTESSLTYSGGNYTDGFSEPQTTGLQFSNDSQIPTGSTISLVTFTVNHNVSATNIFTPQSGLREDDTTTHGYRQYFDGKFDTYLTTIYPAVEQWTFTVSSMPDGTSWDTTNLYTRLFLITTLSRNPVAPPGNQTYRVGQLASSGPPVASAYPAGYLTVTYTPPTIVTVTGSGGAQVSGGATTGGSMAIIAGVPPEITTNQWGLFGFGFRARLEEKL